MLLFVFSLIAFLLSISMSVFQAVKSYERMSKNYLNLMCAKMIFSAISVVLSFLALIATSYSYVEVISMVICIAGLVGIFVDNIVLKNER